MPVALSLEKPYPSTSPFAELACWFPRQAPQKGVLETSLGLGVLRPRLSGMEARNATGSFLLHALKTPQQRGAAWITGEFGLFCEDTWLEGSKPKPCCRAGDPQVASQA